MGYTHYFYQKRDFSILEWLKITEAFKRLVDEMPTRSTNPYYPDAPIVLCDWSGKEGTTPEISDDRISFNGEGDMSHETMTLNRVCPPKSDWDKDSVFQFCKTAAKPYDLMVCSLLIVAVEFAPTALDLSSDGDMDGDDWAEAYDFVGGLRGDSATKDDKGDWSDLVGGLEWT